MKRSAWIALAAVVALVALLPLFTSNRFFINSVIIVVLFVGITVAWNIAAFGGALSLGHAAFFGLGAYTSTLLLLRLDISPWIGMLAGMVVAGVGGLLMSVPLLRLRGPFFTLASLAFLEVLHLLAIFARDLTGGSEGLTVPAREGLVWMSFSARAPYLWIVLAMTTATVLVSIAIYYSGIGYQLRASGSDDEATRALGVHTGRLKVLAIVVSAALTGAFGTFGAQYFYIIDPETVFSLNLYSLPPALYAIIGGVGTVLGPIVGAILMVPIGESLRSAFAAQQGLSLMIYGMILIAVVMVMPGGLVSFFKKVRGRFDKGEAPPRATPVAQASDREEEQA